MRAPHTSSRGRARAASREERETEKTLCSSTLSLITGRPLLSFTLQNATYQVYNVKVKNKTKNITPHIIYYSMEKMVNNQSIYRNEEASAAELLRKPLEYSYHM